MEGIRQVYVFPATLNEYVAVLRVLTNAGQLPEIPFPEMYISRDAKVAITTVGSPGKYNIIDANKETVDETMVVSVGEFCQVVQDWDSTEGGDSIGTADTC